MPHCPLASETSQELYYTTHRPLWGKWQPCLVYTSVSPCWYLENPQCKKAARSSVVLCLGSVAALHAYLCYHTHPGLLLIQSLGGRCIWHEWWGPRCQPLTNKWPLFPDTWVPDTLRLALLMTSKCLCDIGSMMYKMTIFLELPYSEELKRNMF